MLWLEMSRDEAHGGGSWAFGQSLWSPSRKTNGTKWAFWDTLLHVKTDDPVLHLRGKGDRATFVAFSTAAADGFETSDRPPTLVLGAMLGASTVCRSAISLPLTILCCSETFSEGEILNSEVTSWGIKLHLIGRSGCST